MDWQDLYRRFVARSSDWYDLDDEDFAKLKASLPRRPRLRTPQEAKLGPAADTDEDRAYVWMRSLLKFNEERRQQKAAQAPLPPPPVVKTTAAPETKEEALAMGYVTAADVLSAFAERFQDQATLTRYLENNDHIRQFKPSDYRKMVHAGDLIRQLARDAKGSFDQLDREDVQERALQLKQKREKEERK